MFESERRTHDCFDFQTEFIMSYGLILYYSYNAVEYVDDEFGEHVMICKFILN